MSVFDKYINVLLKKNFRLRTAKLRTNLKAIEGLFCLVSNSIEQNLNRTLSLIVCIAVSVYAHVCHCPGTTSSWQCGS